MQKTSANYDRLKGKDPRYFYKVVIDGVGTFQDDVKSVKTTIRVFEDDPQIGKALAGEADVVMHNPSATIPKMARFRLFVKAVGVADKSSKVTMTGENLASSYATYSNGNITFSADSGAVVVGEDLRFEVDSTETVESEWLPQGVYYIDTREVTRNYDGIPILSFHGFDAMLKAEQDYASNSVIGDNCDTAYVSAIASQMGVEVDPRTWDIMGAGNIITFPLGYSCREILGYIACLYIGSFIITDDGKLRLISLTTLPAETNLLIDTGGDVIIFGADAILV